MTMKIVIRVIDDNCSYNLHLFLYSVWLYNSKKGPIYTKKR